MKIFRIILFFSSVTTSTPFLLADALPSDDIDIKHYRFELELFDSTDVVNGKATLKILFNKPVNTFELDLGSKKQQGKGMSVNRVSLVSLVSVKGQDLSFTHENDHLRITMNSQTKPGEELTINISYQGIPEDGLIISKNKFGDRTFFGDNWPDRAHYWLPTIDHPADKATVEFVVTAPARYQVIGNGVKLEESYLNSKQKLTHWSEDAAISTKVMVMGAACFAIQYDEHVGHIPIEHWVYPQNRENGFHDFAAAKNMLDFFIQHIGPYSYKKLANVQSTTRYGGMENASNIFYFEDFVNGKADHDNLIAHEIAHQWFGNSVSEKDWNHVWLSEGFATYFTHLYNESKYGSDQRAADMQEDRRQVIEFYKKSPLPVVFTTLPKNLIEILSINSYQKGSWILHMLRQEIGNDDFWKGIRLYYKAFQNGNAITMDFRRVMENVSGKDLRLFFDQWLHGLGHPVLSYAWKYDTKAKSLQISIKQLQKEQVFSFPLEIGIYKKGELRPLIEKVRLEGETTLINIPLASKPAEIRLDPYINLLFEEN
ncbi:MAG: M1 family metallopeptidase [Bacteroidota bacterium]